MASLTIENMPDELYEKLKASASAHQRSINSELIYCLETVLMPRKLTVNERIERVRSVRPALAPNAISLDEIEKAIDYGLALE
jgi:plasmid stability protein